MVSSIKITKINKDKVEGYADNMVSAKKIEASTARLNKDGSIRKRPGRKINKLPLDLLKSDSIQKEEEKIMDSDQEIVDLEQSENEDGKILVPEIPNKISRPSSLQRKLINSEGLAVIELRELREKFDQLAKQNAQYEAVFKEAMNIDRENQLKSPTLDETQQLLEVEEKERALLEAKLKLQCFKQKNLNQLNSTLQNDMTRTSQYHSNMPQFYEATTQSSPIKSVGVLDIGGYKVKISKFFGKEDEDYDVWWEDLQAYFVLNPNLTEKAKIGLFNVHLGGEARKFIQNEDLSQLKSVEQLHEILRGTFSDKYDWQNVLMNISQKIDEKIRPFSVRLKVAARKCGHKGAFLDNVCVNYLKRSCAPYLKTLLNNCLPNTPYDVIVEHAIQYERAQELDKNQKKISIKRKVEEMDVAVETQSDSESAKSQMTRREGERHVKNINNTVKQIKDSFVRRIASLEPLIDSINNLATPRTSSCHRSSNPNPPTFSNSNYNRSSFNNNRLNNNNNSNTNNYSNNYSPVIKTCLHCAKPNHNFSNCRTATENDKDMIRKLLNEKKFDFFKHRERADKVANEKRVRFSLAPLNSETPDQQ